jgi:uncharacterized membrane protein
MVSASDKVPYILGSTELRGVFVAAITGVVVGGSSLWYAARVRSEQPCYQFPRPSQIALTSPHFVSRCTRVSCLSQLLQRSESDSRILCRRSLLGTMWCITMYYVDFASSDTHDVRKSFHTTVHSVDGLSCVTRIALGLISTIAIVRIVLYTRLCRF